MSEGRAVLSALRAAHGGVVHGRRIEALAAALDPLLPREGTVADVGCGDGRLARLLAEAAPARAFEGFDTAVREGCAIPARSFDGRRLPHADRGVDAVLLVDVLHHAEDPAGLLAEAARVAQSAVVVKDHRLGRPLAVPTLALMDWVGNRPHGVPLRYEYWPEERWRAEWARLGLVVERYVTRLDLYPFPASLAFERGLHFAARLRPGGS